MGIFSGKIVDQTADTESQVRARLIVRLERAGATVTQNQTGLRVQVPHQPRLDPWAEPFHDVLHLQVDTQGVHHFRWEYWTPLQKVLHGLIGVIFTLALWTGGQPSIARLLLAFFGAQCVPVLVFGFSTALQMRTFFPALGTTWPQL